MAVYYIVKKDGPFKSYYTEEDESNKVITENYSLSIRNAKPFASVEAAKALIDEKSLVGCSVIDQAGILH